MARVNTQYISVAQAQQRQFKLLNNNKYAKNGSALTDLVVTASVLNGFHAKITKFSAQVASVLVMLSYVLTLLMDAL